MTAKSKSKKEQNKGRYEWTKPTYFVDKNDDRYKRFKKIKEETGISPDETWNLYENICEFLIPRLILFRKQVKKHGCYPSFCKSNEEWVNILSNIIWSFKYINDDKFEFDEKKRKKINQKLNKGFDLFNKCFCNLWW